MSHLLKWRQTRRQSRCFGLSLVELSCHPSLSNSHWHRQITMKTIDWLYHLNITSLSTVHCPPLRLLPCPKVCCCLLVTNSATAAPNIYSAGAALHLYLPLPRNNPEDNGTPRPTSWGICWWGKNAFLTGNNEYGVTGYSLIQPLFGLQR